MEIAAAIRLRKVISGEWLLVLSGLAAVALGLVLVLFPGPGALALVLLIGIYALVSGVLLISRPGYPHKTFAEAKDGAHWLAQAAELPDGAATVMEEAVAEARAKIARTPPG